MRWPDSAVLDWAASRVARLEVSLGDRATGHGGGVAPPRFRVVLDTPIAIARRSPAGRRRDRLVREMTLSNPLWGAPRIPHSHFFIRTVNLARRLRALPEPLSDPVLTRDARAD